MDPGVFIQRDNFDLGYTGQDITRDTTRFVLGMEGNLPFNLTYEVSAVYGKTATDSVT